MYSKFSPVEACLQKTKVNLRDMLSLVQTNLLKLMIDLKEKDRIYVFFQKYNKGLFIDPRELEDYIIKCQQKDDPINQIVLALVHEYINDGQEYVKALEIWQSLSMSKALPSMTEGCERTVNILRKKKDIGLIKKYAKWVIVENPQTGLTLFTTDPKTGEQPVDMNPDEVIEYLSKFERKTFPYLEVYYEYLIKTNNAADSYFTSLALLYVERIFELQPKQLKKPSDDKLKETTEYRTKLQRFLETKKQYE